MALPLVSCLCVSRPDRWGYLQRAIFDFARQTYENKELVVVVSQYGAYHGLVASFLAGRRFAGVKLFARPARTQLDGLLFAAAQARGDYLAIWDDDNLNHPSRLAKQLEVNLALGAGMTVARRSFYYVWETAEVYLVDHEAPGGQPDRNCAVTSLILSRDDLPALDSRYRSLPAATMINEAILSGRPAVKFLADFPLHFVGVTVDNMRTPEALHAAINQDAKSAAELEAIREPVTRILQETYLEGSVARVTGRDRLAFEVTCPTWSDALYPIQPRALKQ